MGPTEENTSRPTSGPTSGPTGGPTSEPTSEPTSGPTSSPTFAPTSGPTFAPTSSPTSGPTSGVDDSQKGEISDTTISYNLPKCFDGPFIRGTIGSKCQNDFVPITMIPNDKNDKDASYVQFRVNGIQTVTFTHKSGIEITESIGEMNSDVVLDAHCSGDPSVSTIHSTIHSEAGSCTYDIVVPCNSDLMCNSQYAGRRRINENDEGFKPEPIADDGDEEQEDVPYCLAEEFPCEGEEEKMVHICHYIPRQGYQTFCVPEVDTVILEFYPHDYCGPCEGGYGSVGK